MERDLPSKMAFGIFCIVLVVCMIFILVSALIWGFDLIPVTA
jgi:hypothetical protein